MIRNTMHCPRFVIGLGAVRLACLVILTVCASACQPAGWLAGIVAGGAKTLEVPAEYRGLNNRTVAVLVAAPNTTLYQHPGALLNVSRAISSRIAGQVPGASVTNPMQTAAFQRQNITWAGVPPKELLKRLGVERIVMVDLAEYSTHEPGNAHVFRGVVLGKIGVISAESDDPNNFVYAQTVAAQYPPGGGIGLLEEDAATIELGMLEQFANRVTGLFHDHKVVQN